MLSRRLSYDSRKMNRHAKTGDSPTERLRRSLRSQSGDSPWESHGALRRYSPRFGSTRRGTVPVFALLLASFLTGTAAASLCVWRQPDADISAIFGSGSYKTVFADISDAMRLKIEKRLGFVLDADETQFKYFPVFKGTKRVGTVMTHAGKGQFGAIEVVVAVVEGDSGPVIKAVRIQRDREKAKAALRGREFLGQFKGMTANDEFRITNDESGLRPAAKGAEKASQAVANAVRKLLIVYDELGRP